VTLQVKKPLFTGFLENYPFCSEERVGHCKYEIDREPERLKQLLEMAGRERLFNKTQKLQRELRKRSFDETLYRGIMEGLGYRHNKAPFRRLADIVPISAVREITSSAPRLDRAMTLQSLYFGASGLFSNIEVQLWDAETRAYCEALAQTWEGIKYAAGPVRLHKKDWTLAGVRPANFPLRRMAGLSFLMAERFEKGPGEAATNFGKAIKSCGDIKQIKRELDKFSALLCCEGYGYWAHHIVPGGKRLDAVPSLIGEPLAHAIALNTVVPLLLARAAQREDTLLRDRLLDLYSIFPSLDKHRITKLMQHRLWGKNGTGGKILAREINQQGLIQIFNDFCDENVLNCSLCPLPRMLYLSGDDTD